MSLRPYGNLLLACLAQNLATGLTFGSFSLLLEPASTELQSSRAAMSFAIALVLLVAGLIGPWVGRWVDEWSLRGTMALGALVTAAGFYLAATAQVLPVFLCGFGLVGAGFAMTGYIPGNKIAALWFPRHFGRASAVVCLPLFVALLPPFFARVLEEAGWRQLLLGFVGVELVVCGLFWLVGRPAANTARNAVAAATAPAAAPYRSRRFWVLALAMGLVTTSGIVTSAHVVPYALAVGIVVTQASLLLSLTGLFSVLGTLLFGWLADRLTPLAALSGVAALSAIGWFALPLQSDFGAIAVLAATLGLAGGGLMPAVSVFIGRLFAAEQFGATLGQLNFATLPFTFAAAPLIGLLFDRTGSYGAAFAWQGAICAAALVVLLAGRVWLVRNTAADDAAAAASAAH